MNNAYPVLVAWREEDKGFIAIAPDLPGCSAWGENRLEAIKEVETAMFLWIDAMTRAGNFIPLPGSNMLETIESFSRERER
ncbi:type II toxin-antitoxin system HicB family antitoxin [Hyphomicrobium sp.]|uniref:type II toxin-antitoxin system HicB family antitoxin n=1 Tax=Hyphomicrobium sp. TaxID=82 RepID=UPI001DE1C833|nr:type II toxin-antitoxin system HicB family antitoxin [Hyphomicrobium sp.]MBY0559896.1 type II toxin-antitoxin system HicB family antitoxin [Hyphomicrobium sp.]